MSLSITLPARIRSYALLTKPGIIFGNALTAAGAFALASKGQMDFSLLIGVILGLSFIIASACVFNNYIDKEIDQKMERTKSRALVTGAISPSNALFFGSILAGSGAFLLIFYAGLLSLAIAFFGFFVYVACYSFLKYRTTYATLIGSIAGAMPPVVGYTAASNTLDLAAFILFFMLVFWQMPHFYAIAMYRLDDYAAASIPVLPTQVGNRKTKIHMFWYIITFLITTTLLTTFGYAGYLYLAGSMLMGLLWLILSIQGFKASNDTTWARKMFFFSLIVISTISLLLAFDGIRN